MFCPFRKPDLSAGSRQGVSLPAVPGPFAQEAALRPFGCPVEEEFSHWVKQVPAAAVFLEARWARGRSAVNGATVPALLL